MKLRMIETTEVDTSYVTDSTLLTFYVGIRIATDWYNKHLSVTRTKVRGKAAPSLPTVLLLTDDANNRKCAREEGVPCNSSTLFYAPYSSDSLKFCFCDSTRIRGRTGERGATRRS